MSARVGRDRAATIVQSAFVLVAVSLAVSVAWATDPSLEAIGSPEPALHFRSPTHEERSVSLSQMRRSCPPRAVEVDDPYHAREVGYYAVSFVCVLDLGFAGHGGAEGLRGRSLLLEALDGYTRPVAAADVLNDDVHLAYGEVERMANAEAPPEFSAIARRQIDPAPFYLVWTGVNRNDPHTHPWPYQLALVEVASFAEAFPRTEPTDLAADDPGWSGYALFQSSCAACHAINGEGGKVGPDLNVPKSIVEYRPIEQIKAYIRNPEATRYTSMPAHPGLSDADLDRLIAYFRAMSERKRDPRDDAVDAAKEDS